MKIFSVFGVSQSGKTTTIEAIIQELTARGYSVGSVKEIHFEDFTLDLAGSNTARHKAAGSALVTARGLHETDIMYQHKLEMEEIISFYHHDFLVLEGVRDLAVPAIITAHTTMEIEQRLTPSVFAFSGRIAEQLSEYGGLPVVNCLTSIKTLVDLIEAQVGDYPVQSGFAVTGSGQTVILEEWRSQLIAQALVGISPNAAGNYIVQTVKK